MGTIKSYIEGEWKNIGSTFAGEITSNESVLTEYIGDGKSEVNIESVLTKIVDDVNTAKGNISWLALHGGGGSGGGGGGGSVVASGSIKVYNNGNLIDGPIIRKDSDVLHFEIEQEVTQTWSYLVEFNGIVISTGTITRGKIIIADNNKHLNYPASGTATLRITCSSGLSNIYWSQSITKNQLTLTADEASFNINDLNNSLITYRYSATVIGEYTLNINNRSYNILISEANKENIKQINVIDIYSASDIGSNTTKVTLTNKIDPSISLSISHQVIIKSNDIIISSDLDSITSIPKDSTIPCIFTAYYSKAIIMYYNIYINGNQHYSEHKISQFNIPITEYIPTANLNVGEEYIITIKAWSADIGFDKAVTSDYRLTITESSNIKLNIPKSNSLLSDFIAHGSGEEFMWTSSIAGYNFKEGATDVTVKQDLTLYNPNSLSGIKVFGDSPSYYRISNKAYGILSKWSLNPIDDKEVAFPFNEIYDLKKKFTISICFKADYHTENNRTVFQFGELDDSNELRNGILIRVHDIIVKGKSASCSYELQDNKLYTIDITWDGNIASIYINGVITKQSGNNQLGDIEFSNTTNPIFGCSQAIDGSFINFADIQLYRVMFYTEVLNDYDILLNYLQNKSYTHIVSGTLDDEQIYQGLKRNFMTLNEDKTDIQESWFWDKNSNDYSLSNFVVTQNVNDKLVSYINPNIDQYELPIPLLFLDLSSSNAWTWANYTSNTLVTLPAVEGIPFSYYDSKGDYLNEETKSKIINGLCQISIQGTSTRSNEIKNLLMDMQPYRNSDTLNLFIPKHNWLPERAYTLKADIVDSSHSVNAAIGRFINEQILGTDFLPHDPVVKEKFENTQYYQNIKNTETGNTISRIPTLKIAVEGFPVFLICRFYSDDPNTLDIKSLGLYQFILGRDSEHNLGLRLLDSVKEKGSSIAENIIPTSIPYYYNNVEFKELESNPCWIESPSTFNTSAQTDLDNLTEGTLDGLTAVGWHYTDSVINKQFEVKNSSLTPSSIAKFKNLMRCVATSPTCLYNKYNVDKMTTERQNFSFLSYPELIFDNDEYIKSGNDVVINNNIDLLGEIKNYFDFANAYAYYTLCLLFGLVDNFCKNQPFTCYDYTSPDYKFRMNFYDMDTGLGGDNNGSISVPTYLGGKGIINENNLARETFNVTNGKVSGADNKLWLILEHPYVVAALYEATPNEYNPYSTSWVNLRTLLSKIASDSQYDNFTDYFINEYFNSQTEGCGELLFNLTYNVKYLKTAQSSMLTGRRIQQVTQWLSDHIDYLDSLSKWKGTNITLPTNGSTDMVRLYSTDINKTIPLVFNKSLIVDVTNQGGNYKYPVFCEKNVVTNVIYGGGTNSSVLQKSINWSNNLLNIIDFGSSGISKIEGTLKGFNNLNLANCTTLDSSKGVSPINFTNTFGTNDGSELRVIDLSGAINNKNEPNIDINVETFTKLTDINIIGANVNSVILSDVVPLNSLGITGSTITNLNLSNQSLLDSLNVTNCSKLSNITLSNCSISEIIGIDGLNNLKTIIINDCNNTDITIKNCNNLTTIELHEELLESLTIFNCPNLVNLNIAGCNNLKTLKIESCTSLESFITSPSGSAQETSLQNIYLITTKIKETVRDNIEDTNLLDLRPYVNIANLQVTGNENIEYIALANNPNKGIPIGYTFTGCTKLHRIYGHMSINRNSVFNGCSKFTIHNGTFHNKAVTDSTGVYLMPYDITTDLFDTSDTATNITFNTTSGDNMFKRTSCDQFDVYYVFSNPGGLRSVTEIFAYLTNKIGKWGSVEESSEIIDNSLHRDLFARCTNLTSLSNPFRASISGKTKIYSPIITDGVIEQNGLFTPLTNVTYFGWFDSGSIILDRNCFNNITNFNIKSLSYLTPQLIVDNVDEVEYYDSVLDYLIEEYQSITGDTYRNIQKCGNLSGFFDKMPNLTSLYAFCRGTYWIDYSKIFKLPSAISSIFSSFRSSYASGTISIESIFENVSTSLTKIANSFYCSGSIPSEISLIISSLHNPNLHISTNTFNKFTNLTVLGHESDGDQGYSSSSDASFCGYINKTVDVIKQGDNYYIADLFSNLTKLKVLTGLFTNTRALYENVEMSNETVQIPGNLFEKNVNLVNCSRLFYNFKTNYTLTSEGFKNCPNISDLSYIFGASSNSSEIHLIGSIPLKLFYHGHKVISGVTITGTNDEPIIDEETGDSDFSNVTEETITLSDYIVPNASITNISYAFQRNNLEYFVNSNPESEINADYNPFKYNKNAYGVWYINPNINEYKNTIIWNYDGVNRLQDSEDLDIDESCTASQLSINSEVYPGNMYFCCAPDLLRYCKSNANIDGLFAYSGTETHDASNNIDVNGDTDPAIFSYGINGRICPYLLKPVKNITSIKDLFRQCRRINGYIKDSSSYKIPEMFFYYAPNITNLSNAFSRMVFAENINLKVFNYLNRSLNISYLFHKPYFYPGSNISGLFINKSINNLNHIFSMVDTFGQPSLDLPSPYNRDQNVTFGDNFTKSKVTSTKIVNTNNYTDSHAYSGYVAAKISSPIGNRDLEEDVSRYNYHSISNTKYE